MSSTNTTPNFGLPQYIPTDKPTYLGDFNKAMLDIDTNMKNIENKATSAESEISTANATATQAQATAEQAQTSATNAQNTATTAKNTADTAQATAEQAQTSATNAQNTATTAKNTADTAQATANQAINNISKFNLTNIKKYNSLNIQSGNGSNFSFVGTPDITVATNSDGSIAKIYGNVAINITKTGTIGLTFNSDLRPSEDITIKPAGIASNGETSTVVSMTISTTGLITIRFYVGVNGQIEPIIFPCLYFIKNFGDTEI